MAKQSEYNLIIWLYKMLDCWECSCLSLFLALINLWFPQSVVQNWSYRCITFYKKWLKMSRCAETSILFRNCQENFGNFRCTCLGFNTFWSTSLVLVLTKSALHQRFGCWSGLHWNLTELAEILGENLKEFDLSQMCT